MLVTAINQVRRDQTVADLTALRADIGRWLKHREAHDCDARGIYVGRHKTQLQALTTVLLGAADGLATAAGSIDVTSEPEVLYDACRDVDLAIVWLQRLWEFYRDKFDQRDAAAPVGPAVRAADEIVWSCYHEVMERAAGWDLAVSHGAAPLAYIAPEYSPAALDSEAPVTGSLRLDVQLSGWGAAERELVETLPVPLLRLPPWCVRSPWWLVHIAHEVGHELYAALGLTGHVREGVRAAAGETLTETEAGRWRNWAEEIFADVFSVLMMGSAALRGVAEVERTITARMVRPTAKYPAPAVRLALMARASAQLGTLPGQWLCGIDPAAVSAADAATERHLTAVDGVVDFLLDGALPGTLGTMRTLCDARADRWKGRELQVSGWVPQLTSQAPAVIPDITTARHVCAAAVAAWHELAQQEDDETRRHAITQLASAATDILLRSGPEGTRGNVQPDVDETTRGQDLCSALLKNARRIRESSIEGPHGIQD